jgi:hypothetical protein
MNCKNPECVVQFDPIYFGQLYCHRACMEHARYLRRRPALWIPTPLICPTCRAEFLPTVKSQIYCVESCFRKVQRQRPKNKIK